MELTETTGQLEDELKVLFRAECGEGDNLVDVHEEEIGETGLEQILR